MTTFPNTHAEQFTPLKKVRSNYQNEDLETRLGSSADPLLYNPPPRHHLWEIQLRVCIAIVCPALPLSMESYHQSLFPLRKLPLLT